MPETRDRHQRFGKYQLLERIGIGGMAEVFLARTHGAEGFVRQLVIKRILPALSADREFVRMFVNEAHIAARLHHANIVQIIDFDHVDGVYYIAMEWVDGVDLRKIQATAARRQMPVPLNVAVHVGVEALKGLNYAHSRSEHGEQLQLVHRDISPHNLLVSFAGEVKIADFGIAKIAAVASTRTGMIKGKLAYMSPEQVNGTPVDGSTDTFALGIVLWELIANRRLYPLGITDAELLSAVQRAEIPPLSSVCSEVDPNLDGVIQRMVARAQSERYRTATEALADLSELAAVGDALVVSDYLRQLLPAEAERDQVGKTAVDDNPDYREAPATALTETRYSHDARPERGELVDDDAETQELTSSASGLAAQVLATAPTLLNTAHGIESAVTKIPQQSDEVFKPQRSMKRPLLVALLVVVPLFALAGWLLGGVDGLDPGDHAAPLGERAETVNDAGAPIPAHPDAARNDAPTASQPDAAASQHATQSPPSVEDRPPDARSRERRRRRGGTGTINIVVSPWAKVSIDGVPVGITPVLSRPLRSGRHTLELVNDPLKRHERVRIRILSNKKTTIRRDWAK